MECIVKGTPMYYEQYGEGISILLIHGWPADHRSMTSTIEPLFNNRPGWKRIFPACLAVSRT